MKELVKLICYKIVEFFYKFENRVHFKGLGMAIIKWEIKRNYRFSCIRKWI